MFGTKLFAAFLPWKFLIRRAAAAHGVIDPFKIMAHVRSFSQPSEVQEPIELVRAGLAFQARGLINTRAIQFNLDWVWPYWVERQFNPDDHSFIPRAYSATHVNITQRNWTAVGLPGLPLYPLVDPRGMVTPLHDGWSLDFWVLTPENNHLLPSKECIVEQHQHVTDNLRVVTDVKKDGLKMHQETRLELDGDVPTCCIDLTATADKEAKLAAAVRPYNVEGIQFVERIAYNKEKNAFLVDKNAEVGFSVQPDKLLFSTYDEGDVLNRHLEDANDLERSDCGVGLANAAAFFNLSAGEEKKLELRIPLVHELEQDFPHIKPVSLAWPEVWSGLAEMTVPDDRLCELYNAAKATLVLLSADDIVPGPYIYKRFWFRDAALMINGLLAVGLVDRSLRQIGRFFERQQSDGYFRSQEGEWDSNGQVLWIIDRFRRLTGRPVDPDWIDGIVKAARWIENKRVMDAGDALHQGLLPAGFSAEHLGPNDYYFWDDFWGIEGLKAASRMVKDHRGQELSQEFAAKAAEFERSVFLTIDAIPEKRSRGGIPASPYRRMDAGCIGSMVADYPLHITPPNDKRINATLEFILAVCFHGGGFFQDMVHSGVNAYLTCDVAQTLLRNGDPRYRKVITSLAEKTSQCGHWPEAVHPFSGGGCMGDGQHGWAATEWVMLMRNLFVREEGDGLVLGSGLFPEWTKGDDSLHFGPTLTPHGPVEVKIEGQGGNKRLTVSGAWRDQAPEMSVAVPGFAAEPAGDGAWKLTPKNG